MKRKERGFLIVSGIVSLASQLPACKSRTPSSGSSDVASVSPGTSVTSCKSGSFAEQQTCREILNLVAGYSELTVTNVETQNDGRILISLPTMTDYNALIARFNRDVSNFKVESAQNGQACYFRGQMLNFKGGNCGSIGQATQLDFNIADQSN